MTKDERFLLELFHIVGESDDPTDLVALTKKLGYKENLIKEVTKGLAKANFIKFYGPKEIALTPHGRKLARTLV